MKSKIKAFYIHNEASDTLTQWHDSPQKAWEAALEKYPPILKDFLERSMDPPPKKIYLHHDEENVPQVLFLAETTIEASYLQ